MSRQERNNFVIEQAKRQRARPEGLGRGSTGAGRKASRQPGGGHLSMSTLDLSQVPHLAERKSILALLEQQETVAAERYEAILHLVAQVQEARRVWRAAVEEAQAAYERATETLDKQIEAISEPFDPAGRGA